MWGSDPPDMVFLHGGGQNAHTWDTVALALDRPLVAVDLPGHGHSDWPGDSRALDPGSMAEDVALTLAVLAPGARMVVGMSLGGMTSIALAARHPELVMRLALVDITPGVDHAKSSDIAAFLAGPETFASFDEILERTVRFNPTRSVSSLRRGVLHNAVQRDDGTWTWRHQLGRPSSATGLHVESVDFGALWDDLERIGVPVLLARGKLLPRGRRRRRGRVPPPPACGPGGDGRRCRSQHPGGPAGGAGPDPRRLPQPTLTRQAAAGRSSALRPRCDRPGSRPHRPARRRGPH